LIYTELHQLARSDGITQQLCHLLDHCRVCRSAAISNLEADELGEWEVEEAGQLAG
jgi:hypothetical protein